MSAQRFGLLCALAFTVRVALVATSIGTTDVVLKIVWADLAQRHGIARAYAYNALLNHPPLSLMLMLAEETVGRWLHVAYTDVFRFVQVCADAVTVFALYRIGLRGGVASARWLALFFALSPAAAFISGFHCNTDPTMVALTLLAASLIVVRPVLPVWAGVLLACAANIKILPILIAPLFLLPLLPRQRIAFSLAFLVSFAALLAPFVAIGGPPVVANIFGYAGMDHDWGFPQIAQSLRGASPELARAAMEIARFARLIILVAVGVIFLLAWRASKRSDPGAVLLAACGAVFLVLLFFAPGFGVQYLDWPLAFLPFALSRRAAVGLNAVFSIFLFIVYTIWCDGWPWWYADLGVPHENQWMITPAGIVTWLAVGSGAAASIVRLVRRQEATSLP